MIKVFIVDDYQAVRSGIKALLAQDPDIVVVGEAADYSGALIECARLAPDIVLLDISLPGGPSGLDLGAEMLARQPEVKILFISASKRSSYVREAMRLGAKGYLTQSYLTDERLVGSIRTVAEGGVVLDPQACAGLAGGGEIGEARLTKREHQVLELLGDGLTNKEIADRLLIDQKTVRNHLNNTYVKLNVKSRVQAAILARDTLRA